MVSYAQPKMDELRQQYIDTIKNEVQRATIDKLQLQMDTEAAGMNKYKYLKKNTFILFFF